MVGSIPFNRAWHPFWDGRSRFVQPMATSPSRMTGISRGGCRWPRPRWPARHDLQRYADDSCRLAGVADDRTAGLRRVFR